jgi:hypothetical protein
VELPVRTLELTRNAIGDHVAQTIRGLPPARTSFSADAVNFYDLVAQNDARAKWLTERLLSFQAEIEDFRASDFADRRWVANRLRKRTVRLLNHVEPLLELSDYLHEFEEESIAGIYAVWSTELWEAARLTLRQLVAHSPLDAFSAGNEFRERWDACSELSTWMSDYSTTVDLLDEDEPSLDEALTMLLGEEPDSPIDDPFRAPALAYGRSPSRHVELGHRQLRLLAPDILVPDHSAANYLMLAVKLGLSFFPLLAHRSAFLTAELIAKCAAHDSRATGRLLLEFNAQQAGRINGAGATYERLLAESDSDESGYVLPDAYRTLAEGIFRPYASLLLLLQRLLDGEQVTFRPASVLSDVENHLSTLGAEFEALALRGLNRQLRNYEAHEDVVRSSAGVIGVINKQGVFEPLDLDEVREQALQMRSFLDGVDVAANVWFVIVGLDAAIPTNTVRTESLLLGIARTAATATTDGSVLDLTVKGDTLIIVYEGKAKDPDLGMLVQSLYRQLDPSTKTVRVEDKGGNLLLEQPVPPSP